MSRSVEAHFVSYNSSEFLPTAITALREHVDPAGDYELSVAVLDNASRDDTVTVLKERFNGIRLIEQSRNTWYGPASNRLVATSSADFVLIINPDTVVTSTLIEPLLAAFEANPGIAAALPAVVDAEGRRQPVWQAMPTLGFELARLLRGTKLAALLRPVWDAEAVVRQVEFPAIPAGVARTAGFLWSTCIMLPTDVAAKYGPFLDTFPMYDTDLDLSRRLAADGQEAVYVAEAAVTHVGGASSSSATKAKMTREARTRYYRTYHGRAAAITYGSMMSIVTGIKSVLSRMRSRR